MEPDPRLADIMARVMEVIMKMTAATVVILFKKLAGPLLPKMVWLEPPKAAPREAPRPNCSNTIRIRAMETMMWTMRARVNTAISPSLTLLRVAVLHNGRKGSGIQAGTPHEGTVDVRLGHQRCDVFRFYAATIPDADPAGYLFST